MEEDNLLSPPPFLFCFMQKVKYRGRDSFQKQKGGVNSLMNDRRQKSHITSHLMVRKRPHVCQLVFVLMVQGFLVLSFLSVVLLDFNYEAFIIFRFSSLHIAWCLLKNSCVKNRLCFPKIFFFYSSMILLLVQEEF